MKKSKEFLAAMYGAYWGEDRVIDIACEQRFRDNIWHTSYGIKRLNSYSVPVGVSLSEIIKLALKPLSSISDEDAIEVAKIASAYGVDNIITAENGRYLVGICKTHTDNWFSTYGIDWLMAFDYLRSKGYDCGFRDVSSLIEAGLAIDITTLNQ